MSYIKHHYWHELTGEPPLINPGDTDPCADFENDPAYQEWSETIQKESEEQQDRGELSSINHH